MSRGVLYMAWPGDPRTEKTLKRSVESVYAHHPDMQIRLARIGEGADILDKSCMMDLSPFDETLYLDTDTVVLGSLDYGFAKAAQHGLALSICECPWARRFSGLQDRGDIVEFNTGVMFFTRKAKPLFDAWKSEIGIGSSVGVMTVDGREHTMFINDQASFASAVERLNFNPWVLPMNWNFRPTWQKSWFGPIRIYHDYSTPPAEFIEWNDEQSAPDAIIQCMKAEK